MSGRHRRAILTALADGPLIRAEAFAQICICGDSRAYARHLVPLIEAGLVAVTDPDRPTVSTQRYVITDDGRALRAMLG